MALLSLKMNWEMGDPMEKRKTKMMKRGKEKKCKNITGKSMSDPGEKKGKSTLWSKTAKNTDCSTGPLAHPFAHLLAPDYLLRSCSPLCSLIRSIAHFANSLARGTVND